MNAGLDLGRGPCGLRGFLAGCRTRRLHQVLSILSRSLDFLSVCCAVNYRPGATLYVVLFVFCVLVVLVRLSVPVQLIDWKTRLRNLLFIYLFILFNTPDGSKQ